jgi:AcrR family transcriptional regulator
MGASAGAERGDTRSRIQEVAFELFAEQGYEKTSLREIADRLGVTKAALYYHFKSKDEIVTSIVGDFMAQIDDLVSWADSQPRTPEVRREILQRYSAIVQDGWQAMRFFQQNPAANKGVSGDEFRERMKSIHRLMVSEDAPVEHRIRGMLAVVSLHMAQAILADDASTTPESRREAALEVSLDLVRDI